MFVEKRKGRLKKKQKGGLVVVLGVFQL